MLNFLVSINISLIVNVKLNFWISAALAADYYLMMISNRFTVKSPALSMKLSNINSWE